MSASVDMELLGRLLEIPVGVSQTENADAFALLSDALPLQVHAFESGREHNGWVVPHDWRVRRALIRREGKTLFDGSVHPLAVAGYSSSFRGTLAKEELDRHVFFSREHPEAYVFNAVQNYRPWATDWGFCVPWATYREWGDGDYEVELDIELVEGRMLVGEHLHRGGSEETIVFDAHTCHPGQANDDMSGVVVLVALFDWLRRRETRYSYLLVLAPEHLGTVFYLAGLPPEQLAAIRLGCFAEMLGTSGPLVLQQSFTGTSAIDRVAEHVLRSVQPDLHVGPFRSVVGNDETVWEAPGIEVPMISVSRWPYPEYHTSRDDLSIVSQERLDEALGALQRIVELLEDDRLPARRFTGLPALSNPRYDLYVERWDPVVDKHLSEEQERLGAIQDRLLRHLDGDESVFELAERFGVPFRLLRDHLARFEAKGLVELREPTLARYAR